MARPSSTSTSGVSGGGNWVSGQYSFDGSGNIYWIGASLYLYDPVSRVKTAQVMFTPAGLGLSPIAVESPETQLIFADGFESGGTSAWTVPTGPTSGSQTFTYDAFGNLLSVAGDSPITIPINSATNRMNPGGSNPYDTAGNMTSWNGVNGYSYGPFNETWRVVTSNQEWVHVYTADDERLFSYQVVGGQLRRWALRGLDNRVLREYTFVQEAPSGVIERDNIYRGSGPLLAAATPAGDRHYHVDHLGTPRQITDATGAQVAFHTYYPYGEEATSPTQDTVRFKFTGHERDLADPSSTQDDLDHMHARMTNPRLGRFLSVDPATSSASMSSPQSWNRYSYAVGNPIKFVDPDGQAIQLAVALAAAEATATTFDIKQTADVLGDPEASNALKVTTAGLLLLGAVTPGGGYTALGDEIVDAAKLLRQNYMRGNAFEEAGRSALRLSKNREVLHVPGISRGTIPDSLTLGVTEFKDRIKVTNTLQLRLQAAIAGIKGVPFNLVVSPRTTGISESVQQAVGRSGGTIHVFDPGTDTLLLWKNNKQ